jgi:capsular exopolysaccharide synthesis family protein
MVPSVAALHVDGPTTIVSLAEPSSLAAEAYRSVRTSLQFLSLEHDVTTIQVASPQSGDGKTTLTANLAVVLAAAGVRVVVIDADLRRPRLATLFGVPQSPGLADLLAGQGDVASCVVAAPDAPGVEVLASGPVPSLPSEMLSSARFREVLATCATRCDIVLVDSPPLLAVTDGEVIARATDATVVVAAASQTSERHIRQAFAAIGGVGGEVLGFVMNDVERHDLVDYDRAGYYATQVSYRHYGDAPGGDDAS